jgi:D-lactate dehydrogenase (cytochrome)
MSYTHQPAAPAAPLTAASQAQAAKIKTLADLFPNHQFTLNPVEMLTYEVDAGFDRGRPDGVFFPESPQDVSKLMQWANSTNTPLIARGAGTGLSGGAVPEHGGIVLSFARMTNVLDFDQRGRSAALEVGITNLAFDGYVKKAGLYYPPDPSSGRSSVIGGNLGENAGGPHCFKYGVTTNYITGLETVLADGRMVRLGGRALDYPEYDLTGLVVGSEGTLAIATRAYVRLIRNPPGVKTLMVAFNSEEAAGKAVSAVIAAGLVPATLEMMDQQIMRIIESYAPVGLPINAKAALIVEVDGYPASLDTQMEEISDILESNGGFDLRIAQSEAERAQIWYGRKSAAGSLARLAPNFYLVDITVPRSRLADTLAAVNQICEHYGLTLGHVFHAGDGNLHPCISFDARDLAVKAKVFQACEAIVKQCIERDGSITGEHGVGIEKRAYMPMMYTGAELAAMTEIKAIFDPKTLLNPGKILPPDLPPPHFEAPKLPQGNTFAPSTPQEAAAALAALAEAGKRVRIGSAATGDCRGAEFWMSSAGLNGITKFAPEDLYVTVGAGTPLVDLQAFLAEHHMQAPLASPWAETTVGGLVATNLNSPQRLRSGALRDLVMATTVALADGRVIRAGRPVVKNVAGYDLPKLLIGSHGTLGMLTDVTFKLSPLPRARHTLALPVADLQQGLAWSASTVPAWLVVTSVVLCSGVDLPNDLPGISDAPYALLFTLEGLDEDIVTETAALRAALSSANAPALLTMDNLTATAQWANFLASGGDQMTLVRVGLPPGRVGDYWGQLPAAVQAQAAWCVDVGNHLLYARADFSSLDASQSAAWLAALRKPALGLGGYAVVMATPHVALDRWGYTPDGLELMRAIKQRWDAKGILNPGDFIVG